MANNTVLKKEKTKFKVGSRYFTSGDARAYLFIHQFQIVKLHKDPDTRRNITRNIVRNIFHSTWLHGRNILCNITRNIWWAPTKISAFFKIVNYKYSISWLYLSKTKYQAKDVPRAMATLCHHASNIKADKRSEWKYPEQNFWIPNHR